MNIVLFEGEPVFYKNDPRYTHIKKILKKREGDTFFAGIINGSKGKATITLLDDSRLQFIFAPNMQEVPNSLYPITVVIGFPRPIQLRRILHNLASLGVQAIWLCNSELGEKSYRKSSLLSQKAVFEGLLDGCMQAGETVVPEFRIFDSVPNVISEIEKNHFNADKMLLDIGKGIKPLKQILKNRVANNIFLCVGSERGWSDRERLIFNKASFLPCSMGHRILRTETACTVAVAITVSELMAEENNEPRSN